MYVDLSRAANILFIVAPAIVSHKKSMYPLAAALSEKYLQCASIFQAANQQRPHWMLIDWFLKNYQKHVFFRSGKVNGN